MQKYYIKTLADTKKLATNIARNLKGGEVIGLIGDLGAGKTTFTQYLAAALGVKQQINSPTFNIVKIYPLKFLPLAKGEAGGGHFVHIDAYRLHSPAELTALGVEEYFNDKQTITIIEWADKVREILPKKAILIKIKPNKLYRTFTIYSN